MIPKIIGIESKITEIIGEEPNYNFLIIENDPHATEAHRVSIDVFTRDAGFKNRFGNGEVTIYRATNLDKAESLLKMLVDGNEGVSLIGMEQELVGSRLGTEFMKDIQFEYADKRLGALLISAHPERFKDPRLAGIYRSLRKPVSIDDLEEAYGDLIRKILYKQVPVHRELIYPLQVRPIDSLEDLIEHYKLRYRVHGPRGMGYIAEDRQNDSKLDIDRYDPYAIPLTVDLKVQAELYEGDQSIQVGEQWVKTAALRLVTNEVQEPYNRWTRQIIDGLNSTDRRILTAELSKKSPKYDFPSEEAYDLQNLYDSHENLGVSELSRISVPDWVPHPLDPEEDLILRGFGFSRILMEYGVALSRYLGLDLSIGSCDKIHSGMFPRYGLNRVEIDSDRLRSTDQRIGENGFDIFIERVANVSNILFGDLRELPEPANGHVNDFLKRLNRGEYIIMRLPEGTISSQRMSYKI